MASSKKAFRTISSRVAVLGLGALCACMAGGIAACSSSSGGGGPADASTDAADAGVNHPDAGDSGLRDGASDGATSDASDAGVDSSHATPDAGPDASDSGSSDAGPDGTIRDAGPDATPDAAGDASDAQVAPFFCQSDAAVGLNFCQDFDTVGALGVDAGANTWTQVRTATDLLISSTEAVSAPNSLYAFMLADGGSPPGPDVLRDFMPAGGVTQAIYEYDIMADVLPAGAGGFVSDMQFTNWYDAGDGYGFRIGVFGAADGGLDYADLEHNPGSNPFVLKPIPGFTSHAWHHVKLVVAFSGPDADAGDSGTNSARVQLFLDHSQTAIADQVYDAPFATAPAVRISAGVVAPFGGDSPWAVYIDNVTLKYQ